MNIKSKFFILSFMFSGIIHTVMSEEKHKALSKKSERRTRTKNIQAQQPITDYDDYYEETNIDNESNEEIDLNGLSYKSLGSNKIKY